MADSLRLDAGVVRLAVNGDESRIITFNPTDVIFAEKFQRLVRNFHEKEAEFNRRSEEVEAITEVGPDGIPLRLDENLRLAREVCEYLREQVDLLLGEGSSTILFGEHLSMDMFGQFFDGILPYIKRSRTAKMEKYTKAGKPKK